MDLAINFEEMLSALLSGVWMFKELYLLLGLLIVLMLGIDLLKSRSRIRWLLGKKNIEELQQLNPSEFEERVALMYRKLGYKVSVTGGKGDGGIDIEIQKNGIREYVQCKKYGVSHKVSVGEVRDFYGGTVDRLNEGRGYFVTTSEFTKDAEQFARGKPLVLVDKHGLLRLLKLADKENCKKLDSDSRNVETVA